MPVWCKPGVLRGNGLFLTLVLLWLCSTLGALWFDNLLAWTSGLLYIAYDTWLLGFVAWKTRRLDSAADLSATVPVIAPADHVTTIGVLIPARNEAGVLAQTLDALLRQSDPPETILIVDDGSMDGSRALLEQRYGLASGGYGQFRSTRGAQLRLLAKPNSGKADSLNQAWPLLDTEVVVTLDADTLLEPDAIQQLRAAFAHEPQLAACCGVLTPRCAAGQRSGVGASLFEWFQRFEYLRAFLSRAAWMQSDALLLVSGALAAYRREVLAHLGGYDRHSLVEDYELIHRLHRHAHDHALDWRVRVIPQARADTDAPASLAAFLRQRRRWFAGFLQTQFAYRAMQGNPRYGAVGTLMLPIKAVDTLQPVFGVTALLLLLLFIQRGAPVTPVVLTVIGGKLVIDFAYHLWAVRRYFRWLGQRAGARVWISAVLATLAEPFSFQLLRHCGALWGWWVLITGRQDWAPRRSSGQLA